MERKEAQSLGLQRYNTGRLCKHGHQADRYTATGACVQCLAEQQHERHVSHALADRLLRQGELSKERAQALKSAWYCSGELQACGHIAQQRVIDDRCRECLKQELALAEFLLS